MAVEALTDDDLAALAERPKTRDDCRGHAGPCPWIACRYHLYLDVNSVTGSIKFNFPDLEPHELKHTCALDVAERGGITLEEVGEIMNLTRERIRQVEVRVLLKLKPLAADLFDDLLDGSVTDGRCAVEPSIPDQVEAE